jgi:hypothetical protein
MEIVAIRMRLEERAVAEQLSPLSGREPVSAANGE